MVRRHLRGERDGHTLDTAALVHEAYLKLVDQTRAGWKSRSHFLGVASIAMRRILVNYARKRSAGKRGGVDTVAASAPVYDLLGREVLRLHDGSMAAGTHPLAMDASALSAGVYVVRAVSASGTAVRRVTVVR